MEAKNTRKAAVIPENLMGISQLAHKLRISVATARALVSSGEIPGYVVGKHYRVAAEDVVAYLLSRRTGQ